MTNMMKVLALIAVVGGLALAYQCKCRKSAGKTDMAKYARVEKIDAEELKKQMGSTMDLMVVNVLPQKMFDDCHIKGSHCVPMADLEKTSAQWKKEQEIVVYCAHIDCPLSADAFLMLKGLGFTHVKAYEGGIKEWHSKGYPTEGPCEADFLKKK